MPAGPVLPGASVDLDASTSNSVNGPHHVLRVGSGQTASARPAPPPCSARASLAASTPSASGSATPAASSATPRRRSSSARRPWLDITLPLHGAQGEPQRDARRLGLHRSRRRRDRQLRRGTPTTTATSTTPPARSRASTSPSPARIRSRLRVTDDDGATDTDGHRSTSPPRRRRWPPSGRRPTPSAWASRCSSTRAARRDDGRVVHYEWDLDGNGSFETESGTSPVARSYPKAPR